MQMIEILSGISVFLGYVIQIAAQLFVVAMAVFGIVYFIEKSSPKSNCNGNCNQGRNCTCKENNNGI
jgi:uncharacterized membrane protein YphA (DoxX/SURF4 family)